MHTCPLAKERGDDEFLFELYAATRAAEFALLELPSEQLEPLLAMQHQLQQQSYARSFPKLEREIVFVEDARVGHWCVARDAQAIRLVDIALLPVYQNRGIGTALIVRLLDYAALVGRAVVLSVRPESDARRLYQRLGFRTVGEDATTIAMEWWQPSSSVPAFDAVPRGGALPFV